MNGWISDAWLVAIDADVPEDEVRRWWNAKETDLLDEIVADAPKVYLGTLFTIGEDAEPASPVRRVHELLYRHCTLPELLPPGSPPYVLPLLDMELAAALLAAFAARPDDHAGAETSPFGVIAGFLRRYQGTRLVTASLGDPVEIGGGGERCPQA